ncbi:hypothetical protein [Myroides marinus]|uniref:hypothetical protein n=1 Tax=Myroides marinus TaxID=703342 RepID=UPI002578FA0F|nr:hypothetical protein [Myroides marinus]MDM1377330.1 hypothetical protein [Myroides marinus]MDM1380734.1 hypothetical protein [Myroides marinus]MDM1388009.1 hypothetical protein [Myroides marinus]MDM1395221.1 hypothetical protein [Myroides marinus]
MKDKIKVFLSLALVMVGIYFAATKLTDMRDEDVKFINSDYEITKGIVTKKSLYKGHSIKVRYKVGDKFYIVSDGINVDDNISEGDSVTIKYSKTKPELMITQFNEQFNKQ